ncbi:hypothetical protein BC941DRAFT_417401 [Chlamydoabsidia padenii]|nr:hypothetical protein BC941DRAFT_417401 [Chlamydoabsidia padenii]
MGPDTLSLIHRNDIKVKVFYSFRDSRTKCLCTYKTTLTHSLHQKIVTLPLRQCILTLCTSCPDRLLQSHIDCAVYSAYFPSTSSLEDDKALVWEGHGLVSWVLDEEDEKLGHCSFIHGKLYPHHIEVQLELHQTQRMTKKDYYDGLMRKPSVPLALNQNVRQDDTNRLLHTTNTDYTVDKSPNTSSSSPTAVSPHMNNTWEHRHAQLLPPIRFHTINNNTTSPPHKRKRKRKRSPIQPSVIPVSDPNSANANNNNDNHWFMPPHTTPSVDYEPIDQSILPSSTHSITIVPPPSKTLTPSSPPTSSFSSSSFTTVTGTLFDENKKHDITSNQNILPRLPFNIDNIWTIYSIGHIVCDRPHFYDQECIYPVGYKVKRWYKSSINPEADTQYVCEITDGGQGPIFQLEAQDNLGNVYTGPTPSLALQRAIGGNPDGLDFFGLKNKRIQELLTRMTNAMPISGKKSIHSGLSSKHED